MATPDKVLVNAMKNLPAGKAKVESGALSLSKKGRLLGGKFEVRYVVMHHTAGSSSLNLLKSGGDHPPVPGANYLVDRDGTVHLLTVFQCYHAGKGKGYGVPENLMNAYAVGIEVESLGKTADFTAAQKDSIGALVAGLLDGFGLNTSRVINHKDWSSTGKPDTKYTIKEILSWVSAYRASIKPPTVETQEIKPPVATVNATQMIKEVKPKVVNGKWTALAELDLPKVSGHRWMVTGQIKMPAGVTGGEARICRVGWGGDAVNGGMDYTGHNHIAPRTEASIWRTPIHHEMAGGGKVRVEVYLFGPGSQDVKFVAKATLFKVGP